jgi:hypothetical protein
MEQGACTAHPLRSLRSGFAIEVNNAASLIREGVAETLMNPSLALNQQKCWLEPRR